MTDPVKRPTLLPSHATPRERALAQVDARLDDRAAEAARITALKDPATCPAAYLPYLAWERSVDVWDAAWPEDVQRAVVAAAPLVHAHKGTPAGLKAALAALRIEPILIEWWQAVPRGIPYTFEVEALVRSRLYPDGPLLDPRLIQAVHDTVMRVKPLSRAFRLRVAARTESDLGFAPFGAARPRAALPAPAALPTPDAAAGLGLAAVAVVRPRLSLLALAEMPA
jgi:phage tail P2-like protein